ncbi:MAG: hypothetical protein UZ05_CHB002002893 [Chlorobi bacterium OLB5]|nr:MAG: hypothetical protein UZ05_CHB002002893 [Chlorobi bacterium OLB5]
MEEAILGKKLRKNLTIMSIKVPAFAGTKLAATVFESRAADDAFFSKPAS